MSKNKTSRGSPGKPKATPGPKPDVLKLRGKWQNAVRQSLQKKKPASGWPK